MTFIKHKIKLINKLESSKEYQKDNALQRVVEILNGVENGTDLKNHKDLINRISIDSVLNSDSINMILKFTNNYSK